MVKIVLKERNKNKDIMQSKNYGSVMIAWYYAVVGGWVSMLWVGVWVRVCVSVWVWVGVRMLCCSLCQYLRHHLRNT